ncbi:L,D-transpeptidase [Brassicibacter mesophilus]|uniref:L,D-transpeptidase n=1 Tax=Brassicibacter mesophilus TaxID=745119 RepID=UPI003D207AA1
MNRSARTLTLYKNGQWYKSYPIAVGKPSTPTPTGTFTIVNKAVNPGGPFGARCMGLSKPHYGIHGIYWYYCENLRYPLKHIIAINYP